MIAEMPQDDGDLTGVWGAEWKQYVHQEELLHKLESFLGYKIYTWRAELGWRRVCQRFVQYGGALMSDRSFEFWGGEMPDEDMLLMLYFHDRVLAYDTTLEKDVTPTSIGWVAAAADAHATSGDQLLEFFLSGPPDPSSATWKTKVDIKT